ncbi:tyrosine-protein phosphatase non-receptor type protein myopic isoform X2 [Arctopsyche grandis]|uniref:tyrosine-protein phosphatase non-receptor type protein myopic isoform X2 n=1 Tax=Arctopsyche grandis TaxID=121162 RepID=UPI00406D9CF6
MAMEAAPRLPMLSLELKVPHEAPQFATKLKQYIAVCYREDSESYNNEIHQLEGLRSVAVRPAIDLTGTAALKRYFCQLRGLQSRFPMSKGQPVAVAFAWKDLFANIVCTLSDIRFEMVCVLYNVGALHSKLGAAESRITPDSMKAACTHFQNAVWAFQHLKDHFPQPSGVDLSPEIMKLFQDICLAQAQECILEKSMQDSRKPAIVGAIGMQAILHYKSALAALDTSQGADSVHETVGMKTCNAWHKSLSFKIAYISSIVYLFQGMQSEESQKMGERVAFYQLASDKLQEAKKLSKGLEQIDAINEALTFANDVVEGKRKAAKNENEFIYHEEVPDKDLLSEPKPAALAKGIPINFNDPEVSGPDIFGRLVPMRAHEASSMYSEEKAKLLRKVCGDVDAKDNQLNEFMSSLQLDDLNVLNEPERLPQDLIDICASISVKTDAIQNLIETMNNLADIHTEVESMFADIKSMIEMEEGSEKEFQQIIGKRPPSIVSTELSREANKYLEAHNKANESNQTLHKAMTLHLANLKLLSLPLDDLSKHIPSLESVKANVDSTAMSDMRSLVEKVNEMRAQRSMLVLQLRETVNTDDITSQLLTRTGESLDEIFKQEIEKHNKLVNFINQNMAAQENILKALTEAYAKYAPTKKLISDVLKKKESFLTAMKTSYETYEDLLNKSLKGIEFYRKLSSTVSRLLSRLKSICKVQQEERAQLLASHSPKPPAPAVVKNPSVPLNTNLASSVIKDEVSAAPKLKDFLPYMKNRNSSQHSQVTDSSEASYAGHMYPPYVRPAPLGSEGENIPMTSNYSDSYSMRQPTSIADSDVYKPSNISGAYAPNPELNPHIHNVEQYSNVDPKIYQQYSNYYGYNTNVPSENMPNKNFDMTPKETDMGYSNYQAPIHSMQHYDQSAQSVPGYEAYNPNYTNYLQNPMNYQSNIQQPVYSDPAQVDYNKLTSQMQNVNISNQVPNSMYGGVVNTSQMYDMSLQQQNLTYSNATTQQVSDKSMTPQIGYNYNMPHMSPMPDTQASNRNAYPTYASSESYQYNYQAPVVANVSVSNDMQNMYQYQQIPAAESNVVAPQEIKPPMDPLISSHAGTYSQIGHSVQTSQPYSVPQEQQNTQQYLMPQEHQNTQLYSMPQEQQNTQLYSMPQEQQNAQPVNNEMKNTYTSQASTDALPIQSHVQRDFLPKNLPHMMGYDANSANTSESIPVDETKPQQYSNYNYNQSNMEMSNSYQNHPGYGFNNKTGLYDYNYGYQNCSNNMQQSVVPNNQDMNENHYQPNLYTSAGHYGTVQSSSNISTERQTNTPEVPQVSNANPVQYSQQNHSANYDQQPSYIEQPSTNGQNSVTYMNSHDNKTTMTYSDEGKASKTTSHVSEEQVKSPETPEVKEVKEPSALDLLSGLDFSIEQTPLVPEIRVPPVSEYVIRKVPQKEMSQSEMLEGDDVCEDETLVRPPKKDIFADPSLLNKFTQEVKSLQQFVDGLTKKTHSGITMLDSKWKKIQDTQNKDNHLKLTLAGKNNMDKNFSPDVIPYDDSRVKLTLEFSDKYVNASHIKQISAWSIPLIVSDLPSEENYSAFWHMILQQKVSIMVCLLTEIELQGKFYGPTSKNQELVFSDLIITLNDINCNVNWTERKLTIKYKNIEQNLTHYQINVFPARVVSAPLVMLVDKVLNTKDVNSKDNHLPKTLIHCNAGAGRSALIILLIMAMSQVRGGFVDLRDMLDAGLLYLCGVRTNVLEDTKYLVDIYRTVLFYVQGVLCSGTVMFNGEAVSIQSGASVPPPHITTPHPRSSSENFNKFTKESFEEMKQAAGLKSGDMQDPLSYLDPLWSLKKRKD